MTRGLCALRMRQALRAKMIANKGKTLEEVKSAPQKVGEKAEDLKKGETRSAKKESVIEKTLKDKVVKVPSNRAYMVKNPEKVGVIEEDDKK